jgi:hypothetical protein
MPHVNHNPWKGFGLGMHGSFIMFEWKCFKMLRIKSRIELDVVSNLKNPYTIFKSYLQLENIQIGIGSFL